MKRLLTAKEVIEQYGGFSGPHELWRRAREGTVPAISVGRKVLFEKTALDRWIEGGGSTNNRRPDGKRGSEAA